MQKWDDYQLFVELADALEASMAVGKTPDACAAREATRACADAIRMTVDIKRKLARDAGPVQLPPFTSGIPPYRI